MIPNSAVALDIEVPKELETEIHLQVLKEFAEANIIPGFSKTKDGKYRSEPPPALILKFVGQKKAKGATIQRIIDNSLKSAATELNVQRIIGEARLPEGIDNLVDRYRIGDGVNYTLHVDVMPEAPVDNSTYKSLSVTVQKQLFDKEAYEKSLLSLRERHPIVEDLPEGTPAELGGQLMVNMKGFFAEPDGSKGGPLPALASGDAIPLKMQPGAFMPGIVEGLVGIKEDEVRQIKTKFPTRSGAAVDLEQAGVANRDVIFEVECLAVQSLRLPDLNDDFASSVKPGMTWEELKEKLIEGVNDDMEEKATTNVRQALRDALVATLPEEFEVPNTIVNDMAKEEFAMMLAQQREEGKTDEQLKQLISEENYKNFCNLMRPRTIKRVKSDLAIAAIAQQEGLEVLTDEVDEEVMTQQMKAAQQKQKFKESEMRPKIEEKIRQNKVLDFLKAFATIEYVDAKDTEETSVKELLGESPEELAARLKSENVTEDELRKQLELRDATLRGE